MPSHTFDLAAALVDHALDRLDDPVEGLIHLADHQFGDCTLTAHRRRHNGGIIVTVTARNDRGVLASARAHAGPGAPARARIVSFRMGMLGFRALDLPHGGFFAPTHAATYVLVPVVGSAAWDLALGDDDHPRRFASLDDALADLEHHTAP